MHIGFFVWEFRPHLVGGLGVYATEITKKFAQKGHKVSVFTFNPENKLPAIEKSKGIEIFRPKILTSSRLLRLIVNEELRRWGEGIELFGNIVSHNIAAISNFVEKITKKEKFDVIAFHDWLSATACFILEEKIDVKSIFHIHSTEEQRSLGFGSPTIKEIERECAEVCDKIITVSRSMEDFLLRRGYPQKISVVYNGCDPKKYDPRKASSREVNELRRKYGIKKKKVIFFIGRLTWVKGVHNLVKAFHLIKKDFPQTKLIIVGKGEEYQNLISLIKNLRLEKDVIIRNEWLSEKEKIDHFELADLCVFPSITEPFGIVCSEAMAMEKPVVVGASGEVNGFREQVIPCGKEKCGIHVDGNNPEDIAWGVRVILENLEEAKEWGKNGRRRVIEYFNWDLAAEKTLSIYKELTNI